MTIAVIIGSILRIYQSQKRVHLDKELKCQLSNKDVLQSKSVMREIVLRIVFHIRIDYRRNDSKKIVLFLKIHSPLLIIVETVELMLF